MLHLPLHHHEPHQQSSAITLPAEAEWGCCIERLDPFDRGLPMSTYVDVHAMCQALNILQMAAAGYDLLSLLAPGGMLAPRPVPALESFVKSCSGGTARAMHCLPEPAAGPACSCSCCPQGNNY